MSHFFANDLISKNKLLLEMIFLKFFVPKIVMSTLERYKNKKLFWKELFLFEVKMTRLFPWSKQNGMDGVQLRTVAYFDNNLNYGYTLDTH